MKHTRTILAAAFAVALTLGAASCGDSESADFQGDYQFFFIEPLGDLPMGRQRRQGKIIALDVDTRKLAPLHDQLPLEMRARTPEEVRTVALIHCETNEVTHYNWWTSGFTHSCDMRLVAYPSGELMTGHGVTMAPPSRIRFPFIDRVPSRPTGILLDKILELPDQP